MKHINLLNMDTFSSIEARAKWDAWAAHKGKSQDDAKAEYVKVVAALVEKYGA